MKVDSLSPELLKQEYNILCQRLFPKSQVATPFGASWCVVEPGRATTPHRHPEGETFLLMEGQGELTVDGQSQTVHEGDILFLSPQSCHRIENRSEQPLKFLSLWWESDSLKGQKTLIYAAPPTPNGDLHLGHLSGPYLAADLARRALQASGSEALLLCGTDDHQSYVATRAEQLGKEPRRVAADFGDRIHQALEGAGIPTDVFLTPSQDEDYQRAVQGFFDGLMSTGAVQVKDVPLWVDETGRAYIEGMVAGECPHCGQETYGNLCEGCGFTVEAAELGSPTSLVGDCPLRLETFSLPVLNLESYRRSLEVYLGQRALPPAIRAYTAQVLARTLPEIPLAYPQEWGIPFPGMKSLRIHAWAEMAAAYLYAAESVGRPWSDGEVKKILAFGFDNSFYYLFHLPALWMARNPDVKLPEEFLINHFLNLEGEKFSTSRQHAIWLGDALEEYPKEAIRAYLAYRRPDSPDENFQMQEFRTFWTQQVERPLQDWKAAIRSGGTPPLHPEDERALERFERDCSNLDWVHAPAQAVRSALKLLETGNELSKQGSSLLGNGLLNLWLKAVTPLFPDWAPKEKEHV